MKRLFLGLLAIMMLVISGCGDASGPYYHYYPPAITSYQFTKDIVAEFIDGSIDFYAPDSDIDTMTVTVFNSRGIQISRTRKLIDLPRVIEGTIFFSIDYLTYPADTYTFSIILTDFNGLTSNEIVDVFRVP
jgi:hypothetical protein